MASTGQPRVYTATYSNVPVYEVTLKEPLQDKPVRVMRRRADDWVNATHILIVAGFDKAARTKILEREVQRGTHQKVQGGYGGYQGTWISLVDARALAQRYKARDKLSPILDFVPGDHSPPPAPKHTTAASNRARQALASSNSTATVLPMEPSSSLQTTPVRAPRKRKAAVPAAAPAGPRVPEPDLPVDPSIDSQLTEGNTSSDEEVIMGLDSEASLTSVQKRRRLEEEEEEDTERSKAMNLDMQREHMFFTDELLDHLLLLRYSEGDTPFGTRPQPPPTFHPDAPVDPEGHTVLHWAAALADIDLLVEFLDRGAKIEALTNMGETPLVFASQWTNSYQRRTMPRLVNYLGTTIGMADERGCTALHHAAKLTSQLNLAPAGRYYFETILGFLNSSLHEDDRMHVLNMQNSNGDTALIIVARVGDHAMVRALVNHGASLTIVNDSGKSAEYYLKERNDRARWKELRAPVIPPISDDEDNEDDDDDDDASFMGRRGTKGGGHGHGNGNATGVGMNLRARTATELLEQERTRLQDEQTEVQEAITRAEEERTKLKKSIHVDLRLEKRQQQQQVGGNMNDGRDTNTETEIAGAESDEEHAILETAEKEVYEHLLEEDAERTPALAVSSQYHHHRNTSNGNSNSDMIIHEDNTANNDHERDEQEKNEEEIQKKIQDLDVQRKNLLKQTAQEMAMVSTSATSEKEKDKVMRKTDSYKLLIAKCLNVREELVQSLAPALLEHLEAEREGGKRRRRQEGGGGGGGGSGAQGYGHGDGHGNGEVVG